MQSNGLDFPQLFYQDEVGWLADKLNFLQDFLELIARTGVKFHDDTNAPYLQGTKEGLAEVLGWLKQKRQRGF